MKILDLIETDFVNYKKACMTIMFPYCTFKCNHDAGEVVCQNYECRKLEPIEVEIDDIIDRYLSNPVTEAIVMQGLEPFDSFNQVYALIYKFIKVSKDDIVIYTGYEEDEIEDDVKCLCELVKQSNNLIIKFGRFIPDRNEVDDEVLGVTLYSDNQYAKIVNRKEC